MEFKTVTDSIPNINKSCNKKSTVNNQKETSHLLDGYKAESELLHKDQHKILNETLRDSSKTSATVPKKRKYLIDFSDQDSNEKMYSEEMNDSSKYQNDIKDVQENVNCENSCNDLVTIPKKRGRKSKSMASVSVSVQEKSKQFNPNQQKIYGKSEKGAHTYLKKENRDETTDFETDSKTESLPQNSARSIETENQIKTNRLANVDVKLAKKEGRSKKISHNENINDSKLPDVKMNSEQEDNALLKMEETRIGTEVQVKSEKNEKSEALTSGFHELLNADVNFITKRGRPRKVSGTTNNNDSSSVSDATENKDFVSSTNIANTLESTVVPKKRGRKKKAEQASQEPSPIVIESIELDESRSGRKRRKINYLELANELEENVESAYKRRQKFSVKNLEKANASKKPKPDEQSENSNNSKEFLQKDFIENSTEHNDSKQSLLNDPEESIGKNNDSILESQDNNNGSEKKSKYRRTGETVMMINSIFSAALKNKLGNDADESISSKSSSGTPPKIDGRVQRKKSEDISKIIIDEANRVTCATCNVKIGSDDWVAHNRLEHNNLSWREGEQEIRLDDRQAITKILKPILKEDEKIKCKKCKSSFNKVSSFANHLEKCNNITSSNGMVTCAVCKIEVEKNKWPNHKQRQHNNLAWRVGDRPLNLNDQQLVMSILTALYKAKKPLFCEKCGTSKKSVIGFLSHQSQCGMELEEVKVKCHLCDKKVLPVSMQSHIKLVHEAPKEKDVLKNSGYFDEEVDTSKKRKSARTAMLVINKLSSERIFQDHSKHFIGEAEFGEEDFIKNYVEEELSNNNIVKCIFPNCSHESDSVTSLLDHLNSCEAKPEQYYICRKCLSVNITRNDMAEHLKSDHDVDVIDEKYQDAEYEYDDNEDEDERETKHAFLRERLKLEKNPNYRPKPNFLLSLTKHTPEQLFPQSYNFTMSFCQQNYSTENIFSHLRCLKSEWLLLDDELIGEYLPKYEQSCDVARVNLKNCESITTDEHIFKKYNLFESDCAEGIATIFCGGPVRAMAWMPSPYTSKCNQILAVATLNDYNKKYLVNEQYNEESVIQFWNFGVMLNKQQMIEPQLLFCLAHNFGPVWHLEWCPSGCYDVQPKDDAAELSRMGLLAVAGSDSAVYIYSIPHLKDQEMGLIYKVKPLLKLVVVFDEENYLSKQKFYATRTSWSKASGHRYMAVGYTDGVVSLFDLGTTSTLLKCKDEDDLEVLLPYKTFQPHTHMVTVLDLVHMADGKRWLLTGSFDRNIIVWDLSSGLKISSKRGIISDGLWLTNWLAFLSTADESSTKQSAVPNPLASYRDYLYERVNLTYSSSSVTTVSESAWLNGIIYCSATGGITAVFPHQLMFALDNDRRLKDHIHMFGYTKLISKDTSKEKLNGYEKSNVKQEKIEYEPITYEGANEKYGLLFCDTKKDGFSDFTSKMPKPDEDSDASKAKLYPMQAINKVAYNPNLQASLYYATGYQAGFVRVTYIKFLEKDQQIK